MKLYFNGEEIGTVCGEIPHDVTEIFTGPAVQPDETKGYLKGVNDGIEFGKALTVAGYYPNRILKSGNRTIVFWNDGEKTIVKRADGEPDNTYVAFTAAFAKRFFGSNSALNKLIQNRTVYQEVKK